MLETGDFYNAIIVCHDAQWHVHTQILASRSTWFRRAFQNAAKDGGIPEVNLASQSVREVEVLLYHIYSNGSLLESEGDLTTGSFTKFAKLYKLGETFEIQKLMDDALTCLGQFCDDKLQVVCSYAPTSGRNGILAHPDADFEWIGDLFAAIYFAFGTEKETSLQTMLVSFCFGGRMLFFGLPEFRHLVDNCWAFNTAMVKLMLPGSVDPFAPVPICTTAADVDHTHRSQKPDRCGDCKKTFSDVDKNKKALYHPWKAEVRATTYCGICVERMKKDGLGPPWRREPVGYNP
ncbi:hypothetical protein QBC39DRAFT_303675 [Podospora conica]|nr:hypothetical protein QBC39DRAFT_303675 [Schizothecium conicum]